MTYEPLDRNGQCERQHNGEPDCRHDPDIPMEGWCRLCLYREVLAQKELLLIKQVTDRLHRSDAGQMYMHPPPDGMKR